MKALVSAKNITKPRKIRKIIGNKYKAGSSLTLFLLYFSLSVIFSLFCLFTKLTYLGDVLLRGETEVRHVRVQAALAHILRLPGFQSCP
jgi:hypothetical protein